MEFPDICILSKKLLLQDLNQKTIKQNANPKKELIDKISKHFEAQYQNEKIIKEQFLSKIVEDSVLYNKIQDISAKDVAEIVKNVDLNNPNDLCKVLRNIDKDESFINKMVSNDSYQEFIKVDRFDSNEHQGQEYISVSNDIIGDNEDFHHQGNY